MKPEPTFQAELREWGGKLSLLKTLLIASQSSGQVPEKTASLFAFWVGTLAPRLEKAFEVDPRMGRDLQKLALDSGVFEIGFSTRWRTRFAIDLAQGRTLEIPALEKCLFRSRYDPEDLDRHPKLVAKIGGAVAGIPLRGYPLLPWKLLPVVGWRTTVGDIQENLVAEYLSWLRESKRESL